MTRTSATPRLVGTLVLSLLALFAAILPAAAAAAPEAEAEAPLEISNSGQLPKTTVGFQSYEDFTISSTVGAVELWSIWTEGSDFWIDWGATDCSGTVESCTVRVDFAPGDLGLRQGTLRIQVSGYEDFVPTISGEGVAPQLTLEPSSVDFGVQRLYQGEERQVQIRNSGEAPVQLSGIDVEGPDQDRFWNGGNDCWSQPEGWLEPGDTCTAAVYFQPYEVRDYEATLKVSVNADSFTAPLAGAGGQAVMEAAANPVEFGAVTAGVSGDLQTIVLVNNGNLPGSFFIAVVAGGDARSFELVDETCSGFTPVEPGEDCLVQVRFTPQGSGPKQARLALFGEDDGGTMIFLTGEGVAPSLLLDPVGIEFGTVAAGSRSAAQPVALRNNGPTPVELGGVGIVGADPDQFLVAGDACTGATLAGGQACQVRVRFAPGSAGAMAATLRVGAPGGALTATLAGTGTPAPVAAPAKAKTKKGKHKVRGKRRSRFRRNATVRSSQAKRAGRSAKKKAGKARHTHSRSRPGRG